MTTSFNKLQGSFFAHASVRSSNNDNFTVNPALTCVHGSVWVPPETHATDRRIQHAAIAMHCNFRPPDTAPMILLFNWSLKSVNLSVPVLQRYYCDLWPLTFDREHGYCIGCDVFKLCNKFERNRIIRSEAVAISIFDLMTSNVCHMLRSGFGIIFTEFEVDQPIRSRLITLSLLMRYVKLWPWPLTLWPWTCIVHRLSGDQTLYRIWAKSINLRLSY